MTSIVARIIGVLREPRSDAAAVDGALLGAAFLFEKARGLSPCGWSEEIVHAEPTAEEMAKLRDAMVAFAERTGTGAWVLGKCNDRALRPVLVSILRRQLHGDAGELFQAMVALSASGEPVFGGAISGSILDEEENRALAGRFLEAR
jgi:hypothetical protein